MKLIGLLQLLKLTIQPITLFCFLNLAGVEVFGKYTSLQSVLNLSLLLISGGFATTIMLEFKNTSRPRKLSALNHTLNTIIYDSLKFSPFIFLAIFLVGIHLKLTFQMDLLIFVSIFIAVVANSLYVIFSSIGSLYINDTVVQLYDLLVLTIKNLLCICILTVIQSPISLALSFISINIITVTSLMILNKFTIDCKFSEIILGNFTASVNFEYINKSKTLKSAVIANLGLDPNVEKFLLALVLGPSSVGTYTSFLQFLGFFAKVSPSMILRRSIMASSKISSKTCNGQFWNSLFQVEFIIIGILLIVTLGSLDIIFSLLKIQPSLENMFLFTILTFNTFCFCIKNVYANILLIEDKVNSYAKISYIGYLNIIIDLTLIFPLKSLGVAMATSFCTILNLTRHAAASRINILMFKSILAYSLIILGAFIYTILDFMNPELLPPYSPILIFGTYIFLVIVSRPCTHLSNLRNSI